MNWQQICANPAFNDLPFKFETNEWGKIEMSPAGNTHSVYQSLIMKWFISSGQQGLPISECSVGYQLKTGQNTELAGVFLYHKLMGISKNSSAFKKTQQNRFFKNLKPLFRQKSRNNS